MLSNLFVQYILPPLVTLLASGGTWVLGQLALWLQSKKNATKTQLALMQLAFLAEIVVADIEAHERDALHAAAADGKVDKAELDKLANIAMARILALAKERGFLEAQKLLETMAPAGSAFLSGIVERAVAALPNAAPEPASQMTAPKADGVVSASP